MATRIEFDDLSMYEPNPSFLDDVNASLVDSKSGEKRTLSVPEAMKELKENGVCVEGKAYFFRLIFNDHVLHSHSTGLEDENRDELFFCLVKYLFNYDEPIFLFRVTEQTFDNAKVEVWVYPRSRLEDGSLAQAGYEPSETIYIDPKRLFDGFLNGFQKTRVTPLLPIEAHVYRELESSYREKIKELIDAQGIGSEVQKLTSNGTVLAANEKLEISRKLINELEKRIDKGLRANLSTGSPLSRLPKWQYLALVVLGVNALIAISNLPLYSGLSIASFAFFYAFVVKK